MPVQLPVVPDFGITVYVSVACELLLLVKVCEITLLAFDCAVPPIIAPTGKLTGTPQV